MSLQVLGKPLPLTELCEACRRIAGEAWKGGSFDFKLCAECQKKLDALRYN